MPVAGSTVLRRQLGRRLRRLRDAAGKTERDVEAAKLMSRTKLWRIESGKVPVKIPDARALCWLYGADDELTDGLAVLAAGTLEQGWWEAYDGVLPDWFGLYVGLEASADRIRTYEAELVPGLLQTPGYARAVCHASRPTDGEQALARRVRLRMERQQAVFSRTRPPRIEAVLGAGVLARRVGSARVMAEQVAHLREQACLGHADIRVLPWDAGAHSAMEGPFVLLDFENTDDPPTVYLEAAVGCRYAEKAAEVAEYRRVFDLVYKQTIPIGDYQSTIGE